MDDVVEKLRLLNYENTYCKKFNKVQINKFYFASEVSEAKSDSVNSQFIYFYELSNWLLLLIKQVFTLIYISNQILNREWILICYSSMTICLKNLTRSAV